MDDITFFKPITLFNWSDCVNFIALFVWFIAVEQVISFCK
jgi:hypothetical protein